MASQPQTVPIRRYCYLTNKVIYQSTLEGWEDVCEVKNIILADKERARMPLQLLVGSMKIDSGAVLQME